MFCRSRPWASGYLCVGQHGLGTTVSVLVYRHCRSQQPWWSSCDILLTYVICADGIREFDASKSGSDKIICLSLWCQRHTQGSRAFPGLWLWYESNTSVSVNRGFPWGLYLRGSLVNALLSGSTDAVDGTSSFRKAIHTHSYYSYTVIMSQITRRKGSELFVAYCSE